MTGVMSELLFTFPKLFIRYVIVNHFLSEKKALIKMEL